MSKIIKKKKTEFFQAFHEYLKNELINYPDAKFTISKFATLNHYDSKQALKKEITSPSFSLMDFLDESYANESIDLYSTLKFHHYLESFSESFDLIDKYNHTHDLFEFIISKKLYRLNSYNFELKREGQEISFFSVLKDFIRSADDTKKRDYTDVLVSLYKPYYSIYHTSAIFDHDPTLFQSLLNSSHFKREIRTGELLSLAELTNTNRVPKNEAVILINLMRDRIIDMNDSVIINVFNKKINLKVQDPYSWSLDDSFLIPQDTIPQSTPKYSLLDLKTSAEFSTELSFSFATASLTQQYSELGLDIDVFKKFKTLKIVFKDNEILYNVDMNISSKEINFLTTTFSKFDDESVKKIQQFKSNQLDFYPFLLHFFITEYFNYNLSNNEKKIGIDLSSINLSNIRNSLNFLNTKINNNIIPAYREKLLIEEIQAIPKETKSINRKKI